MTTRKDLLLAYGIAEYDTALAHLDALDRVGFGVPLGAVARLRTERLTLIHRWITLHGTLPMREGDITEVTLIARKLLGNNVTELDELLDREGIR